VQIADMSDRDLWSLDDSDLQSGASLPPPHFPLRTLSLSLQLLTSSLILRWTTWEEKTC
jgi:hypothetical protein